MALLPQKISERTPAGALTGAEILPLIKGTDDLKVSLDAILDWINSENASAGSKSTTEGGFAIRVLNKTGAASVKGTVVIASTATANAVATAPIDADMPIGVMYENGIADGQLCWVVVSGIAEVLFKNTVAPILGGIVFCSSTAGRVDISNSIPSTTVHYREVGHCFEAKAGGTNVLAKCVLHFN